MTELVFPPQWARLGAEALAGTVMIVGAPDTGKSTLARYLFQRLCARGLRVGLLDADVGQSTLGVPTTLNLALAAGPGDKRFPPRGPGAVYFVGATTPRGHMLPLVIGCYRLQQRALALGAEALVVDTTGLVDAAQGGKALKQGKIELLAPGLVIGLQRSRELEPILWPLRRDARVRCVELPVSPHVQERTREARIARRRERLAHYFAAAQPRLLDLRRLAVYDLEQLGSAALLALQNAEGFALALAVVEQTDRRAGTLVVRTPLASVDEVASIRFGAVRWDLANPREM